MALAAPARDFAGVCDPFTAALGQIEGLYGAASLLPGSAGVGLRFAGRDMRAVRAGLTFAWGWARTLLTGTAPNGRRKD